MKFLKLQIHPWCFRFLGNPISCLHLQEGQPQRVRTIKLIKSDGVVKIYDRPIHVSQLMMEFPKHLVCRSDSFYIGQKIPALSEKEKLQLGHNYFLLPKHFFQTVLSFVTIASFASKNAFLKKAASCQPFDIQRSPSGCVRIRISDEFISQLMMEEEGSSTCMLRDEDDANGLSKVCTTPKLHKDYMHLVDLRQWKPKLETIKEKEKKRLSSFGIGNGKKRKNKLSLKNQKSTVADHFSSNSKSSKIKNKSRKSSTIGF